MLAEVVYCILNGVNLFCILITHINIELLFQHHNNLKTDSNAAGRDQGGFERSQAQTAPFNKVTNPHLRCMVATGSKTEGAAAVFLAES